jgi:hypothetical protein
MDYFECSPNIAVVIQIAKRHYGVGEGVEIVDLLMLDYVIREEYWAQQISTPWVFSHELVPATTAFLNTLHPKSEVLKQYWRTPYIRYPVDLFQVGFLPNPIDSVEDFDKIAEWRWEQVDTLKMIELDW